MTSAVNEPGSRPISTRRGSIVGESGGVNRGVEVGVELRGRSWGSHLQLAVVGHSANTRKNLRIIRLRMKGSDSHDSEQQMRPHPSSFASIEFRAASSFGSRSAGPTSAGCRGARPVLHHGRAGAVDGKRGRRRIESGQAHSIGLRRSHAATVLLSADSEVLRKRKHR